MLLHHTSKAQHPHCCTVFVMRMGQAAGPEGCAIAAPQGKTYWERFPYREQENIQERGGITPVHLDKGSLGQL